jgi:AraC-like DNA-binding protein
MKIDLFQLPDYFNDPLKSEVSIHHFIATRPQVRNKIILSQNLICILLHGTKEIFGSHQSLKIDNKEILLFRSGSTIMWESTAENNRLESLLIFFSNGILKDFCNKYQLNLSGTKPNPSPVLNLKKDEFMLNFERSLVLLADKQYALLHKVKLQELLLYLVVQNKSGDFGSFVYHALGDSHQQKFREVVMLNANNGLTVDELAFLCNMSISTFKRHFMKTFQCPPKKYLTDKKMEKARQLLLEDRRPTDIFPDLRYQSLASFSSEFKKYFGISPKQFQQRIISP